MAEPAQVIVSSSGTAVGVHLVEWKKGPSASISPAEAKALARKLLAAAEWCDAHAEGRDPPRSPDLQFADEVVARVKAEGRRKPAPAVDPDEDEFA